MSDVPQFTSTVYEERGIDHRGLIADNSAFTIGGIKQYLSDIAIEVENVLVCPVVPEPPEPEEEEPEDNWEEDCLIGRLLSSNDSGSGSGSSSDSDSSKNWSKKNKKKHCEELL